jgi:uncharacterized membrane protein YbhN (UPF0104 family)
LVTGGEHDGGGWLADQLAKSHRLATVVLLAAVLSLGALVGVTSTVGFERVWRQLLHPHWIWIPIAVVCEAVAYLGYTFAYREVARVERGPELDMPKAAVMVTTGFGVFVQGGGFALDRAALERAGLSREEARTRVLGLGSLEYALLAPATALAALFVLIWHPSLDLGMTLPWVIGVPLGTALALLALRNKERFHRRGRGLRRHIYDNLQALTLLLCLFKRWRTALVAFLSIAVYWFGDIACLWASLHLFFAHTPPVAQLLVGYASGYALTRRMLPLGGAGIVESLLPFSLGWVGITLAPALLGVAAYRATNLWLPMLPALAGLPSLRRLRPTRRSRPARGTA